MTWPRWELNLPYPSGPPLSLNRRLHWAQESRVKNKLQEAVGWLLKGEKVPALDHAWIWLAWTPGITRRRDSDNPEPTRKVCIDTIVRAGLLEDDTPEFVSRPENLILPVVKGLGSLVLVISAVDPKKEVA